MSYVSSTMSSPVGVLTLIASDKGLAAVLWENDATERVKVRASDKSDKHPMIVTAKAQLKEYFAGKRESFDVPLDMQGTEFQKKVWKQLLNIPFGETRSYGELARKIGNINASRAVGAANGKNPLSIIVPCHRVIGASGKLTGFAGGLEAKAHLLGLEAK